MMVDQQESFNGKREEVVSLSRLSDLTGFPTDFIKKELLIQDSEIDEQHQITMETLRKIVSQQVDKAFLN